jgi:hypothetical protein
MTNSKPLGISAKATKAIIKAIMRSRVGLATKADVNDVKNSVDELRSLMLWSFALFGGLVIGMMVLQWRTTSQILQVLLGG